MPTTDLPSYTPVHEDHRNPGQWLVIERTAGGFVHHRFRGATARSQALVAAAALDAAAVTA